MKVEFEFDTYDGEVTPIEGVAVLHCFVDGEEQTLALYGNFGEPNSMTAIGLYTVALEDAKRLFAEGEEYGED
jgi:hypothetical protein